MDNTLLAKLKTALRIDTDDFDDEINDLVDACLIDLRVCGVSNTDTDDKAVLRAVIAYVKLHFGTHPDGEFDRLSKAYDSQKAKLMTATGYTEWGNE